MTTEEEYFRLIEDRDEKEQEVDYLNDQIRLGLLNEDEEERHINALENEIMYLTACIEECELILAMN